LMRVGRRVDLKVCQIKARVRHRRGAELYRRWSGRLSFTAHD
jgi:hypothetical protein